MFATLAGLFVLILNLIPPDPYSTDKLLLKSRDCLCFADQKTEFRPPGDLRHFFTIFNYSDVETRGSVPDGGRIFINNPGQTAPNRIKMEKFIGKR